MATVSLTILACFPRDLLRGVHDFESATFKVMLSNTAPDTNISTSGSVVQLAAGNGYTTGGNTITPGTATLSTNVYQWNVGSLPVWTASSGTLGSFQYLYLVNSTANKLVGYWNLGSPVTLAVGGSFSSSFGTGDEIRISVNA